MFSSTHLPSKRHLKRRTVKEPDFGLHTICRLSPRYAGFTFRDSWAYGGRYRGSLQCGSRVSLRSVGGPAAGEASRRLNPSPQPLEPCGAGHGRGQTCFMQSRGTLSGGRRPSRHRQRCIRFHLGPSKSSFEVELSPLNIHPFPPRAFH
jgi:hypothetical protein